MSHDLRLLPGDHLFVDCQGYSHHGIHVGDGQVIHFDSTLRRKLLGRIHEQPPNICEISLEAFAGGRQVHVRRYLGEFLPPDEVVLRARSRVGEFGYDLFDNNCEHFAVWCKTGRPASSQVESVRKVARTGAAGIAFSSAVIRSARYLPMPYRAAAYSAGAAVAVGATVYRLISEKKKNRSQAIS